MAGVPSLDLDFNKHVDDLIDWNEDAGFVWGTPTVVVSDVVTVVHPHTYPSGIDRGGVTHATVIAVYTLSGERLALHCPEPLRGKGFHHNYWGG